MNGQQWYVAVGGPAAGADEQRRGRSPASAPASSTARRTSSPRGWPTGSRSAAAPSSPAPSPAGAPPRAPPPPPPPRRPGAAAAHEIDYEIFGEEMQFVEITLDPGEAVHRRGRRVHVHGPRHPDGDHLRRRLGAERRRRLHGQAADGRQARAHRRVAVHDRLRQHRRRRGRRWPSPRPTRARSSPLDLRQLGGAMLCQKDAFLCAAKGISVGIAFQKKLGAGLFGGEGFILQKLDGDGLAFVHAGGTHRRARRSRAGETLRLDTGCLVAFEPAVNYDIQMVPGIKTALFGGEGLFFATLTGPGKVWLQSLPFSRLASRVLGGGAEGRRQEHRPGLGPRRPRQPGDREWRCGPRPAPLLALRSAAAAGRRCRSARPSPPANGGAGARRGLPGAGQHHRRLPALQRRPRRALPGRRQRRHRHRRRGTC